MSAKDKYQRPVKEQRAAEVMAARGCCDTQMDTAQRTIALCLQSPRRSTAGTFAHDVVEQIAREELRPVEPKNARFRGKTPEMSS